MCCTAHQLNRELKAYIRETQVKRIQEASYRRELTNAPQASVTFAVTWAPAVPAPAPDASPVAVTA